MLGGDELLPMLVLALGAAMAVGNGAALLRPRPEPKKGELTEAPRARSLVMVAVGVIASVWAVASLVSG